MPHSGLLVLLLDTSNTPQAQEFLNRDPVECRQNQPLHKTNSCHSQFNTAPSIDGYKYCAYTRFMYLHTIPKMLCNAALIDPSLCPATITFPSWSILRRNDPWSHSTSDRGWLASVNTFSHPLHSVCGMAVPHLVWVSMKSADSKPGQQITLRIYARSSSRHCFSRKASLRS